MVGRLCAGLAASASGKAGMALLLQAALVVLAGRNNLAFDGRLESDVRAAHLAAPVVGARRGPVAVAVLGQLGRGPHALDEVVVLVIAELLGPDRRQPRDQHQLVRWAGAA